jgi:hypothetical protein
MSSEMNLLYLKPTGHVLAGFTRSGEPARAETTADGFVGDGLHLRGFGDKDRYADPSDFNSADLVVPAAQIGVFRMTLDMTILGAPSASQVTNLDTTPKVQPFSNASPSLPAAPPPLPNPPMTVTLTPAVSGSADAIFVFIPPSPAVPITKPLTISSPIGAPSNQAVTVPVPSGLASGEYYCLIFITGYPACVLPFQVP